MKLIRLLLLMATIFVASAITAQAQQIVITPRTNAVKVGVYVYPLNHLVMRTNADSTLVGFYTIEGLANNSNVPIYTMRAPSKYTNGLNNQPFASFAKMDSAYTAWFVK